MILVLTVSILVVLFTCHILMRYSRTGRLLSKVPGPTKYPIIGNLLDLHVPPPQLFYTLRELAKRPIFNVSVCHYNWVGVRDPDALETLLTSQRAIDKAYIYDYFRPWLHTGLLTSTGDKWHTRRKMLTPVFHFQILRKYLDIAGEQTDKYINELGDKGSETIEELGHMTSTVTLNIICESAMGVNLNKITTENAHKYKKAIHDMGHITFQRVVKPYILDFMMEIPLIKLGRIQTNALKVLHHFTDKVVVERKEYHKQTENKYLKEVDHDYGNDKDNAFLGTRKRLAMLDHLLLSEKKGLIDDAGIREEVDTFTFEGHDTTGMGLFYALMLLAENKDVQDKARAEVNEAVEKNNGDYNVFDNNDFSYVERCIKEALRLYPSVPMIGRYLVEDITLKGYVIPAGTSIGCLLYDLHRDPKLWPEPEKFDPDRFLPENCVGRHPFAYLPFSAGPRNCIGQKFAMLVLKSILARILYNYYLEPIDRLKDIHFLADLVLRPSHPVNLKFIKIKH